MKLNLPLQSESTETLVRDYRRLRKMLGTAHLLVRAIWNEIRKRQKDERKQTANA